jgi:cyclopropane-fatty-acyl-phospholipid synthase
MSITNKILGLNILPDSILRRGIRKRLSETLREHQQPNQQAQKASLEKYIADLKTMPIAISTDDANEQHYEVPTKFYQLVLGENLKYSSGYWTDTSTSFNESEAEMLRITCERAQLEDGMNILELGCGWGSLSLWMAKNYPNSTITSVSNSKTQKEFIDAEATRRGYKNLTIRTANMIYYEGEGLEIFDRVVSVEMFEHMKNYQELLRRISTWLKPDGKMFVHIFAHKTFAYHYEVKNDDDWMAKYFFTGGQMPSHDLLLHFQDHLKIEEDWRVNGSHYGKTSEAWLANMDKNKSEILPLFAKTYGAENVTRWWVWWRLFFMACAELWSYDNGKEWIVSHYRFEKI